MRKEVIKFLKNPPQSAEEQFEVALRLYSNSPGKNVTYERRLIAQGCTLSGVANLKYDLQKIHFIQEYEYEFITEGDLEVIDPVDVNEEIQQSESTTILQDISIKDSLSIREEFPFLNEKDCPNELKILVSDKITAWKKYQDLQTVLANEENNLTKDELGNVAAEAVALFEENQLIYEELDFYKNNGVVLGNHPVFKTISLQREVDEMSQDDLLKFNKSSPKYFSDNKKSLEAANADQNELLQIKIKNRIHSRTEKLNLVNKKLGFSGK